MPREVRSREEFVRLAPAAQECRVVRGVDFVKLKLRTPEYLHVFKTNEDEAENLLKELKDVEIVEIKNAEKEKKEKGQEDKQKDEKES